MHGSAGGLARIDAIFHSHGYTETFSHSPMIFGAFPSLHAGCATMEALFLSHYFPRGRGVYWTYAFVLYWSTMYLTCVRPPFSLSLHETLMGDGGSAGTTTSSTWSRAAP